MNHFVLKIQKILQMSFYVNFSVEIGIQKFLCQIWCIFKVKYYDWLLMVIWQISSARAFVLPIRSQETDEKITIVLLRTFNWNQLFKWNDIEKYIQFQLETLPVYKYLVLPDKFGNRTINFQIRMQQLHPLDHEHLLKWLSIPR